MSCSECRMLEDHVEIAREEVEKIRGRIAEELSKGAASHRSMRSLERAERTLERCQDALQRHLRAGHASSPWPLAELAV